jgi:hypothetical protein
VFLPKPGDLAPVEHARGAFLHAAFRSWWSAPELVPDALLAHLAPLGWQHINLTGDYFWGTETNLGLDGFRPLRGGMAPQVEAA